MLIIPLNPLVSFYHLPPQSFGNCSLIPLSLHFTFSGSLHLPLFLCWIPCFENKESSSPSFAESFWIPSSKPLISIFLFLYRNPPLFRSRVNFKPYSESSISLFIRNPSLKFCLVSLSIDFKLFSTNSLSLFPFPSVSKILIHVLAYLIQLGWTRNNM